MSFRGLDLSDWVFGSLFVAAVVAMLAAYVNKTTQDSKIEYFNIMCANSTGPTFQAMKAKNYDVRGTLLEVTAASGQTVFYEVPPNVMCVADPVTTEEMIGGD